MRIQIKEPANEAAGIEMRVTEDVRMWQVCTWTSAEGGGRRKAKELRKKKLVPP